MRFGGWFNLLRCGAILLIVGLGVPLAGLVAAAGETIVSVSPSSQTVDAGGTFTIDIAVEPGEAIAGVQFDLGFDPSLVTVSGVEEGNLLSQGGASTYFISGDIDNGAGTVTGVAGAIISPGQTVSTAGTFAVITLVAGTVDGTSSLELSNVVAGDINGNSVPIILAGGEVAVDVNQSPLLASIGNRSVNEGELLQFTVSATDPDGDALTYSASNLPSGASFTPATRLFSWTPTSGQAGTYSNVRFEVSDGVLTDYENITITVNGAGSTYEDWDVNSDGAVNVLDMVRVGQYWDETGTVAWVREDVNEDGAVNVLDMTLIGQHWTG